MKPHRTDGVSLAFGLIFFAVALWWAVAQVTTVRLAALGWIAAGGLILIGVVGLIGAIRSGRRQDDARPELPEGAAAQVTDDDLPPGVHGDIVRELLHPMHPVPGHTTADDRSDRP